jgi:thiamine-monophosphate kinase
VSPRRTVADLGEFGLIEAIQKHLPAAPEDEIWSGDDAAVVESPEDKLVLTTDVLVEGIDFDLGYFPAASVGVRAMAVNASDIAAMGGIPTHAVATLALPSHTDFEIVDGMAEGLASAGAFIGVTLVGGDISEASEISIAVAVVGSAKYVVARSGAQPDELICVTGTLGGAAGGLRVLREQIQGDEDSRPSLAKLAMRQLAPTPRIKEGRYIAGLGATAMIDVSDGLLADLTHVLDASGCGCRIDPDAVPVDESLDALESIAGIDPLELALTGGEDYELLFTIPAARRPDLERAFEELGSIMTVIGETTEDERIVGDRRLDTWSDKGWQHLRSR